MKQASCPFPMTKDNDSDTIPIILQPISLSSIHRNNHIHLSSRYSQIAPHSTNENAQPNLQKKGISSQSEIHMNISDLIIGKVTKVLIVDDNPFNILCLRTLLKNFKFLIIQEAHNGKEAVNSVVKEDYDLILMDVNMPIMDGFEATKIIKQLAKTKKIPQTKIFIATALEDQENKRVALQIGADAHIIKPITLSSLYHELKNNYLR